MPTGSTCAFQSAVTSSLYVYGSLILTTHFSIFSSISIFERLNVSFPHSSALAIPIRLPSVVIPIFSLKKSRNFPIEPPSFCSARNIRIATIAFLPLNGVQECAHKPLEWIVIFFPSTSAVRSLPVILLYSAIASAVFFASSSSTASKTASASSGTIFKIFPPFKLTTFTFPVDGSVSG